MTEAEGRAQFREWTNERNSVVVSDVTINGYLDAGLQAANRVIRYYWQDATLALADFTSGEIALPTDFMEAVWVDLVASDGQRVNLAPADQQQLERESPTWRNAKKNVPTDFLIYGSKLLIWPQPSDKAKADYPNAVLRYISGPPSFNGNGFTGLGTQDHRIPIYFAVAEFSEAHPDSAGAEKRAAAFLNLFSTQAAAAASFYEKRRLAR